MLLTLATLYVSAVSAHGGAGANSSCALLTVARRRALAGSNIATHDDNTRISA